MPKRKRRHNVARRKKRILFVCTANIHRSVTAEMMLAEDERYEVRSAGISMSSPVVVDQEVVEWADIIFVMDERNEGQKTFLLKNFPMVEGLEKKIIVLDIPDRYVFAEPALVKLLAKKLKKYIEL